MTVRVRIAVVFGALVAAIGVLALVLHSPFVRARVLRYARAEVQARYAVRLVATRLDYNLAALRVGLADVRVSTLEAAALPFFEADYLSVTLPGRVLLGGLSFDDISVTSGRVRVVRRQDGSTNLPRASDTPSGEPSPLRIGSLNVPRLTVEIRDESRDLGLLVPAMAVRLTPDGGQIALGMPADVRMGGRSTRIDRLEGGAAFDGRALRLSDVRLQADEASLRVDGSLTVIARESAVDLRVQGSGDLAHLARWAVPEGDVPDATLAMDARITGPTGEPEVDLQVGTDRLTWQRVAITELSAQARVTPAAAEVRTLEFGLEGGRVTASGLVPFEAEAPGRVSASWSGVDAAGLVAAFSPGTGVLPAGTLAGQLEAEGLIAAMDRWSATGMVSAAPRPNARNRLSLRGGVRLALDEGRWRLEGSPVVGGVAPIDVAVQGQVSPLRTAGRTPRRSTIAGAVRLGRTDVPDLLDVLRVTSLASTAEDVVGSGAIEADMQLAGSLADPTIEAQARLRELASPQFETKAIDVTLSGRPLARRLELAIGSGGALVAGEAVSDIRAAGRLADTALVVDELFAGQPMTAGLLTAAGRYNVGTGDYMASLEVTDWQLTPTAERPLAGRANLRFAGEGTVSEPRGTGHVRLRGAVWQEVGLGDLEAGVRLDGRMASFQARAPQLQAEADGQVQLDAPYAAVVDLRAEEIDLARALRGLEPPTPVAGTAMLTAHAEGPLETWRTSSATVEVVSLDATAGDLPVRLLEPARLRYAAERVVVDRFEAAAGDMRISASGELPAFGAAADAPALVVEATGDVGDVARAAAATGVAQVPVTGGDGPVALLARITGSLQEPVVAADLEVGPGSVTLQDVPSVSGLRLRAHAEDGWIELREAGASYQGATVSATGRAPISLLVRRPGPAAGAVEPPQAAQNLELHARASNVSPAVVEPFLSASTLAQLTGSLDVTLDAASPTLDLADLTGELRLDRLDLRIADLPVTQRAPTRIVAREGFARIEAWDWVGQGATLALQGQVRLADRQAAILANGDLDLRLLTPFVRDAGVTTAGRLQPRISMTGAVNSPRIDGDLLVSGGEVRLVEPRVLVSDLTARAVLTGNSVRLTSLTGLVNGGPLTGSGLVEVGDGRVDARLSTDVRSAALEFPQGLRSEVHAALELGMAAARQRTSGRLSGTVTVVRSAYREPMAVVTGLLTTLRARRLAAGAARSPLLESLALDVRVVTDEDMIVDNNYGRFQLGGDLRVIGTAAAPALSGRAELREGGQLFVGRNIYTVTSGTIDFADPLTIEPDLGVVATTRAGGVDIEVRITGTPDSPSVDLSSTSDPSLGQAEVASLLLTGRRLEDLAPGDAAFVGTQVLGNFSAEVLGFASRAIGLDTVRLGGVDAAAPRRDPTTAATEIDPTARLTFGKSLSANLDVTFSQSLRDSAAQTWIVDYLPARRLELRLVSDDDDLRTYSFRHDVTLGGAARPTAAEGPPRPEDLRVAAVSIDGDLVVSEARVRDILRLEPGDRFDFGAWLADRDRLEQFYQQQGYLTARIAATRADRSDGVALAYQVTPGPATRIEASGLTLDAPLRVQLERAWAQSVFDEFLVEEATTIVRERLARDGYFQPAIDARVVTEGGTSRLVIAVRQGARSTGTQVRAEGADEALRREIEAWLASRGLVERAALDPGALEREVTTFLRERGYLRATVTAGAPLFDSLAVVPLTVDAGPVFRVTSVTFRTAVGATSTSPLPPDAVRDAAALPPGTPYDPAAADAARDRLVALFRREGFPAATVVVQPRVHPTAPAVDLTFAIDAGARQVVGEVVVSGNRAIDTDVIVRALDLTPGAPLRAEETLQARRRVFDTGLFRRVDVSPEAMEAPEGDAMVVPMRVRVDVEEWPAVRLRYGFQVAEERPDDEVEGRDLTPGLSADLTRRTLFGRAIATGGALEIQRRERLGRLFINTPTLFGWPIESSLVLERSREEPALGTFVTDRSGISWEQRTRVGGNLSLSYAYRFERDHTFDTAASPGDPLAFDITVNIARLTGSAAWDTRDDPADTVRGALLSSSLEWAPESAGSDIRFIRQLAQAYYFRPWRNVVLASAGRLGVVRPLGGQDLILSERFFGGGARTVRGVAEGTLGGLDFFGSPVGGQALVVLNQEVRVPIYRWIRGVGFVDAGNVFRRIGDVSVGDLVGSVGAGLRVATPFALIRADYARPVWGTSERSGRWTFGIGHAF